MSLPVGIYNTSYAKDLAIIRTRWQWALTVLALVLLFTIPLYAGPYWVGVADTIGILVIATLGIQILVGYAGQVSIGHAAFVAVGAYTATLLVTRLGFPYLLALIGAGLVAGIAGAVFGGPSLRIKGWYLVMSTLAAHYVITYIIAHWDPLTGGMVGLSVQKAEIASFRIDSDYKFYYLIMVVLLLCTYAAVHIVRGKPGRAFVAVRDNDLAANVMGINVWFVKLQAFFIGCFFAGIAGGLYAPFVGNLRPDLFPLMDSVWYLGYCILGGMGSITGAFFGPIIVTLIREALSFFVTSMRPELAPVITAITDIVFGVVLAAMLILDPRGLAHIWSVFKAYYRLWPLARR